MFHVKQLSSEQKEKLEAYASLLQVWNAKINLIGKTTEGDVWQRHIVDSAQLIPYIESKDDHIADLGAGAGLPGIVLSALGCDNLSLIESDKKKCVFLREVRRSLGLNFTVIEDRIENIQNKTFDVITSRAMATISTLLDLSDHIRVPSSRVLLLKGARYKEEIDLAKETYSFEVEIIKSQTSNKSAVINLTHINRGPLA